MKTTINISQLLTLLLCSPLLAHAGELPEPGLVMYGAVRNSANGNALLTTGTLTGTITPACGSPVTVTTPLADISGQYSYALGVPFASVVGGGTLSPNTLQLNSTATSYVRTNVFLTVNGTNYPATISLPALGTFTFGPADRGRLDEVDLTVTAPGVTGGTGGNPFFASTPHLVNGQFQMTVNATTGQSYTLLTSTDLVNWSPAFVFLCTNSPAVISDPAATNFNHRFYRLGP
jgi:hypothetical protein